MRYGLAGMIWLLVFSCQVCAQEAVSRPDSLTTKQAPESLQRMLDEATRKASTQHARDADIEIDGMLIDETKTKGGRDFFDHFYIHWEAPPNAGGYSIFVVENPYRMMTTQIEVRLNETLVFRSFLQPRTDVIEQQALQAVSRTRLYLANYEALMRQLDGADKAGTGIF